MRNSQILKQFIDDGLAGKNLGISTGSSKLDLLTGGLQRGRYDLLGGTTGSSKTAFADNFYILKPWTNLRKARQEGRTNRKLKVFYWSLEIRKKQKLAKWMGWLLFQDLKIAPGIKRIGTMVSDDGDLQKHRMSQELYDLIMARMHILDEMDDDIHIIDPPLTPKGLYAHMSAYGDANGRTETIPIHDPRDNRLLYNKTIYVPNDPDEIVMGVVDHCGLMRNDKGEMGNKKAMIDLSSSMMVSLRNKFEFSFLNISQFNRELADVQRQRFKELTPQMEDFKDTGNSQEDAEVIMAMFNPFIYNMEKYKDYNIRRLTEKFKSVTVLKNRNGSANISLGYNFEGAVGAYRELPKGIDMTEEIYQACLNNYPDDVRLIS